MANTRGYITAEDEAKVMEWMATRTVDDAKVKAATLKAEARLLPVGGRRARMLALARMLMLNAEANDYLDSIEEYMVEG